jgi:hypothetical protein
MSSDVDTKYLSGDDLDFLHGILADAGYSGDDGALEEPSTTGVAANLLIRLFQEGVTSHDDLTLQLERHFGRFVHVRKSSISPFHRYAIQGLPMRLRKRPARLPRESKNGH